MDAMLLGLGLAPYTCTAFTVPMPIPIAPTFAMFSLETQVNVQISNMTYVFDMICGTS